MHGLTLRSSKEVVGRVFTEYNIKITGWVQFAPTWIGACLERIGAGVHLVPLEKEVEYTNFQVPLPCNVEQLDGICIGDSILHYKGGINTGKDLFENYTLVGDYFSVNKSSSIPVSIEEGTAKVFFQGVETDDEGYIMIEDLIEVREACLYYILKILMQRGLKLSFIDYTNVYTLSEQWIERASNVVKMLTPYEHDHLAYQYNCLTPTYNTEWN
jgi:hypothetical protein